MSDYLEPESSEKERASANLIAVLFLGIGFLIGGGIGSERAWNSAGDWAVQTTRHCEASYRKEGFSSVTECLKGAIAHAEQEQREERQAEGSDPRG